MLLGKPPGENPLKWSKAFIFIWDYSSNEILFKKFSRLCIWNQVAALTNNELIYWLHRWEGGGI